MHMRSTSQILVAVALFLTTASRALCQPAGNLVQNGGFETGDFTGWNESGNSEGLLVSLGLPHSGNFGVVFGSADTPAYISQTLATSPGETYTLSFWVASGDNDGGTPNEFIVKWSEETIVDEADMVVPAWTNMQFQVTAISDSTTLTFGGWDNPDYILLDDVSVAIPGLAQPAIQVVSTTNNLIHFAWGTIEGQMYQVQYKTNLSQPSWSDFGASAMATNTTMTASDNLGPEGQRFYRVVLLQ